MSVSMRRFYLGVDGGGTKTEAILCDASGRVLFRSMEGSTNPNDVGINTSLERLFRILEAAHAQVDERQSLAVFCGISGALNHREALTNGLRRAFPQDDIAVHSDAINLLSSELADGDGCCLICGTGSVCFVRHGTDIKRIGGWGYLLDASGSGFSIGREALEAALRSHDGRGDATLITGAVWDKLGGPPWEKLTEIYEGGKAFIASFAPCVLQCAEQGDRIAFEILFRQALYLADCLRAAYELIGAWETSLEVILGGGLFTSSSELVELIKQNATVPIHLTVASVPPVFGAVWESVRQHRGAAALPDYAVFKAEFRRTYPLV